MKLFHGPAGSSWVLFGFFVVSILLLSLPTLSGRAAERVLCIHPSLRRSLVDGSSLAPVPNQAAEWLSVKDEGCGSFSPIL